MEHKQVIVLRKDLNMRKGKMVAQGAHASMRAILQLGHAEHGNFVIPVDERIEPWLLGRFNVPTYTAVAVGPDREDRVDAITGTLSLL